MATVFRALLKDHKAGDIGLFGCSAGGLLTAQSLVWFQKEKLPRPGTAGIFCASADARWAGDSWFWQMPIQGIDRAPSLDERFYYAGHDLADPLLSPVASDAVLAGFPPTLLITAARAGELSSAITPIACSSATAWMHHCTCGMGWGTPFSWMRTCLNPKRPLP